MNALQATEQDIQNCYRLLLLREPDGEGFRYWREIVNEHRLTVSDLVGGFLGSAEFLLRYGRCAPRELVELPEFSIFVDPDDFLIGRVIQRDRNYEPPVSAMVERVLHPGAVFVDVGANIGYFSLLAARLVEPGGHVHAFEPNPNNCEALSDSLRVNKFDNVTLHPVAVSDGSGELLLEAPGKSSNGRVRRVEQDTPGGQRVTSVSLDQVLAETNRLDLIKVDIEGAEPLAFRGMKTLLKRHRPAIIFEFSPSFLPEISGTEPLEFLREIDDSYDLYVLDGNDDGCAASLTPEELLRRCESQESVSPQLNVAGYPRVAESTHRR